MKRFTFALAGIVLATAGVSAQAQDVVAGKAVFDKFNCASCHGADAKTSVQPEYPVLAGQHADYLAHALKAYKRGAAGSAATANVRKNPIMGAFAAQLSDQDIRNVAAWLAAQLATWACASKRRRASPRSGGFSFLALGALADQLDVGVAVERRTQALSLPYHLAQAFHDFMGGLVRVAAADQALVRRADAARMVDRQLLGDRQVHGQVQEWVGAAVLDRVLGGHGLGAFEVAVVLGMFEDPVQRHGFERGQDLGGAVLAPGFDKEFANLVAGRIEHRRFKDRREG